MPDYNKGTIYKIVCNISGKIYIGSTCQSLAKRLGAHVSDFKKGKNVSSSQVIANGNYCIILIEEYTCENKQQLLRKEREYIEALECVNRCKRPIISIEERKDDNKKYRNAHYNNNKDKVLEQCKEYRNNNKDKIKEKAKQYRIDKKTVLNEKVKCSICKKELNKRCLKEHCKRTHKPDYTLIE